MKFKTLQISATDISLFTLSSKGTVAARTRARKLATYDQQPRMCAHDAFLTASGGDFGFVSPTTRTRRTR